jgi:serine/threonine-protein kinase
MSPTITTPAMTQRGVILGTAAYMAPEQAKGKPVDQRSDIWAFGCVLYEKLTGKRAFLVDDLTDTIVAIFSKEPDSSPLQGMSATLRRLLRRCLQKDARHRLQSIADARIEIEELIAGSTDDALPPPVTASARSSRPFLSLVGVLIGIGIGAVLTRILTVTPPGQVSVSRFAIVPSPSQALAVQGADRDIAISPDGRVIAYRADPGLAQLVIRSIDRIEGRVVPNVTNARHPFFSPDGQWVAFFDGTGLKKLSTAGGPAVALTQSYIVPRGASWGDDNFIVFATSDSSKGLIRVPAAGGEPTVLTTPDTATGERSYLRPFVLPGSRAVVFTVTHANAAPPDIAILDLQTGTKATVVRNGSHAEYLPTGHLLYAVGSTLHAVTFDLKRLAVVGEPVPVVDDVMTNVGASNYAVSHTGTFVYVPATATNRLRSIVWVDRTGRETPVNAPLRQYTALRLSPDGSRGAFSVGTRERDVWVWDFNRETLSRLTFDKSVHERIAWTSDGAAVVFGSQRDNVSRLFKQRADGSGSVELLTEAPSFPAPSYVAPNGTGIVGTVVSPKTNGDIVWFPTKTRVDSPSAEPAPALTLKALVATSAIEWNPEISPDGRYLGYQSNESGREEIYVKPFPRVSDGRWQVSTDGGTRPVWSRDGRELFYFDLSNTIIAVPVEVSSRTFSIGKPLKLFTSRYATSLTAHREYDVARDGRHFLMLKEDAASDRDAAPAAMIVVQNWFEELKARVPTK